MGTRGGETQDTERQSLTLAVHMLAILFCFQIQTLLLKMLFQHCDHIFKL